MDVLRGAANATLDMLSRAIADPAPVSDPQQAEELAYILSVVRAAAAALRRRTAAPRPCALRTTRGCVPSSRHRRARALAPAPAHADARLHTPQVRWKNNLALFAVHKHWLAAMPQFIQSWLANCVLCYLEYFLSGGLWALWVYKCARAGGCKPLAAASAPSSAHARFLARVRCP